MPENKSSISFVFFGTSNYSVQVLEELKKASLIPSLIVTTPDAPKGRGLELTSSPVKVWAQQENIPLIQPEKLNQEEVIEKLKKENADVFIVIAYGKIIPKEVISIPAHGTLNIHASLLPKFRGASPIETAILEDEKETGVTIMEIDEKMDQGPIIAQEKVIVEPWPPTAHELGEKLVHAGARLLIQILPDWISGNIKSTAQDHAQASYTKKIEKKDGFIDISLVDPKSSYENFRKIQAFKTWPTAYFFIQPKAKAAKERPEESKKEMRVIIKEAVFENNELKILKVIPEGKKEMSYEDFKRGFL